MAVPSAQGVVTVTAVFSLSLGGFVDFKEIVLIALIAIAVIAWIVVRRKEIIASKPPDDLPPRQ